MAVLVARSSSASQAVEAERRGSRSGRRASSARTRSIVGRWNDDTSTVVGARARASTGRRRPAGSKSAPGVRVLHLDVDEPAPADVEDLVEGRDLGQGGPDLGRVVLGQGPTGRLGVVVDDQPPSALRWTSSSTPVGPELPGPRQRGERCSRARSRLAPRWREHERPQPTDATAAAERTESARNAGQTPCATVTSLN